jgi:hypothetical protein
MKPELAAGAKNQKALSLLLEKILQLHIKHAELLPCQVPPMLKTKVNVSENGSRRTTSVNMEREVLVQSLLEMNALRKLGNNALTKDMTWQM